MNKKKFRWYIPLIIILSVIILFLCNIRKMLPPSNKINFTFQMENSENIGILGIESNELNSQTLLQGVLCVNHSSDIEKIDLFMPDMGHGSSPPVLSKKTDIPPKLDIDDSKKSDYGCFNISKMEMFMPGLWQVRVFYNKDRVGIFNIYLKN